MIRQTTEETFTNETTTVDHHNGHGEVIIDQLSPDFRWFPVMKNVKWTKEHRTQLCTSLMRPYIYPQDQIDDCIRC
jgi:hypothetical protein